MKKILITKEQVGCRLDKFLAKEFFSYTRGEITRKIKTADIIVNNAPTKPSYILSLNDVVTISNALGNNTDLEPNADIKIEIIFENDNFIVINKPPGIQVHPSIVEKEWTVANWLLAHYPEVISVHDDSPEGNMRPGIVHRLDKDTSGLMLLAKNMHSFVELKKLFSNRNINKKYVALVCGYVKNDSGIINISISRSKNHKKQVAGARKNNNIAREAVTEYEVLKRYDDFTLVEAHPLTGRMHQIRVHFTHLGHPIVGDKKYSNRKFTHSGGASRQLLHAKSISFELFGQKYSFQAPLPHDFKDFLANID